MVSKKVMGLIPVKGPSCVRFAFSAQVCRFHLSAAATKRVLVRIKPPSPLCCTNLCLITNKAHASSSSTVQKTQPSSD